MPCFKKRRFLPAYYTFISKLAESCPWIRTVVTYLNERDAPNTTQSMYFGHFDYEFNGGKKGWKGVSSNYRCIHVQNDYNSDNSDDDETNFSSFNYNENEKEFCSWQGETKCAFSLVQFNGENGSLALALQILQDMKESGSLFQDVSACLFVNAYNCSAEIIGVVLIDFRLLCARKLPQRFRSRLLQEFLLRNLPTSGWVEKEENKKTRTNCKGVMHNNVKRDKAYEDEENAIAQKKKNL